MCRRAAWLGVMLGVLAFGAAPAAANPLTWTGTTQIDPGGSPFGATSSGASCQNSPGQAGTNYPGTQVEPWIAVDPSNNSNAITVWQQDRWSNGAANGLLSAYSTNGGLSWTTPAIADQPGFDSCTGGSGVTGGFNRASDAWVTVAPNGDDYFMALQADIGITAANSGMAVSKSTDHGATWSTPISLKFDTSPTVLNDKNSITADRVNSNDVYAIWDRLVFPNSRARGLAGDFAIGYRGPTWFSRTTDGGANWGPAHIIYDPGEVNQTIGNQIVQTGDGTLVDAFALLFNFKNTGKTRGFNVAVLRSGDHGATWSGAHIVAHFTPGTVSDPTTGAPVRTGDIIPEVAIDPTTGSKTVYLVWQAKTASSASSVIFSKSTDDGVTWSAPRVIDTHPTVEAFTPSIRVGSDGGITVTYYDFRSTTTSPPLNTDVWSLHSSDHGGSWSEDHIAGPFDMSTAPISRGYFVGDYEGLDAGFDTVNSTPFYDAAFGVADGTTTTPLSHINSSQGQ
jgi:BNR repeat-like domain